MISIVAPGVPASAWVRHDLANWLNLSAHCGSPPSICLCRQQARSCRAGDVTRRCLPQSAIHVLLELSGLVLRTGLDVLVEVEDILGVILIFQSCQARELLPVVCPQRSGLTLVG